MTESQLKQVIEFAHQAGQRNAGIDASPQAARDYYQSLVQDVGLSFVSECTTRDWVITYADSDGTIQKAVASGKTDDEAIANFQDDYHQEWRTIKAIV